MDQTCSGVPKGAVADQDSTTYWKLLRCADSLAGEYSDFPHYLLTFEMLKEISEVIINRTSIILWCASLCFCQGFSFSFFFVSSTSCFFEKAYRGQPRKRHRGPLQLSYFRMFDCPNVPILRVELHKGQRFFLSQLYRESDISRGRQSTRTRA